jgi:hypothetical protein
VSLFFAAAQGWAGGGLGLYAFRRDSSFAELGNHYQKLYQDVKGYCCFVVYNFSNPATFSCLNLKLSHSWAVLACFMPIHGVVGDESPPYILALLDSSCHYYLYLKIWQSA